MTAPSNPADRILQWLEGRDDEVLDLTRALIAAPSPNLPGDETAPAQVLHEALAAYGLPPAQVFAEEPHRPNLVVRIEGARPGPNLALCGHTDTKPVGEAAHLWRTDPFVGTIDGDRLYGLGSTDMKGAVAAMVLAGAAVNSVREELSGTLTLLFTADEEYGSARGAGYLVRSGALAGIDAILLGEPSGVEDEWDAIRVVSRGIACFAINVEGTQTHSSISDMLPSVNAVEAMANIMVSFREAFHPAFPAHPLCPTGPTINIGVRALGGVGYGVLPGHAEFWTDVRTTPGMTRDQFYADVERALAVAAAAVPGATVSLVIHPTLGWLEPSEVGAGDPLVVACQHAAKRVLGAAPPLALFPGATDAYPFHVQGRIPTLPSFGPGQLPLAHGANEWVAIPSLGQAMRMYGLAALEYLTRE